MEPFLPDEGGRQHRAASLGTRRQDAIFREPCRHTKGRRTVDWRLELVPLPVADVDRAKSFYAGKVGFNVDLETSGVATRDGYQTPRVHKLTSSE